MTQDEVDLIYAHLHDNYFYREDGVFINKKTGHPLYGHESRNGKSLIYELCFRINNKKYHMSYSHSIYLYHHGLKPRYIKHIDGNSVNNKIENLEIETMSNRILAANNKTKNKHGYRGVVKDGTKYYARIMINKKFKWISSHDTPEDAHNSYLKEKLKITK